MRVGRAPVSQRVATVAVVVALAWLVVGWGGPTPGGGTRGRPGAARPTIQGVDALAAVVWDRPTPTTRSDRGPLRVLAALVETGSGSPSLPPALAGDVGVAATPFATGPLAFGLARRGPPAPASR